MQELWNRYLDTLPKLARAKLPPGAVAEKVQAMETGFGYAFPRDLRDFFLAHQGQGRSKTPLLDPWYTMGFDELLKHWSKMGDLASASPSMKLVIEGPVQAVVGCRGWIPFARDAGDRLLAFDLEPAAGGWLGQLIEIDLERGLRRLVSPSLRQFLRGRMGPPDLQLPGLDHDMAKELEELWPRLLARLAADHPATLQGLLPGLTASEVASWESCVDFRFAPEVALFFSLMNGQSERTAGVGLFRGWWALASSEIGPFWEALLTEHGDGCRLVCEGPVKRDLGNRKWVPFAHDFSGNVICFDHDPSPGGRVGQVIEVDYDCHSRRVIANSIVSLLAEVVEAPEFPLPEA
jgi:cell wall assembly regulator SMI1